MSIIGTGRRHQKANAALDRRARSDGVHLLSRIIATLLLGAAGLGCSPRVKIEAPDKPIEINVNVKIEQEVRIKLDKAVERTLDENPELFGTEKKP
jgi:hypothetical protein